MIPGDTRRSQESAFGFWIVYLFIMMIVIVIAVAPDDPSPVEQRTTCVEQGGTVITSPENKVFVACEYAP